MPVTTRPTIPTDAETLAKIWLESLQDNPMVKLASPEGITPQRLAKATGKVLSDLEDETALCLTALDSDTGDLMGCAVWRYYPHGKQSPEQQDGSLSSSRNEETLPQDSSAIRDASSPNIGRDLEEASAAIFQIHIGERPHATLSKLQTSPQHERKGVASALMAHGLVQTKLPCYHFSTPKAARLYEKYGFTEIDRVQLDLGKYGGEEGQQYVSPFYYRPGQA